MSEYLIPEFYDHSEPVARKQHYCVECSAPILEGEKHFFYSGKWDGNIEDGRQHLLCLAACLLIRDEFNGECIPFGELWEWWGENRYQCGPPKERNPKWKRLRDLLAKIKIRERQAARVK